MTIDEILAKYQKALTKKQIDDLIQKSEQYKLLNAGNRANAQTQLAKQYRQTRRGLQNMGLAGREGKLISGREIGVKDAYRNAYGSYNQQLNQAEGAMLEQDAARKAASTARARAAAAQKAAEEAKAKAEAQLAEQQQMQNNEKWDAMHPGSQWSRNPQLYTKDEQDALWNYDPFKHTANENVNYYLQVAAQNGMKGVEANRYAMSMAAEVANRKGAAAEAIQPHGLKPNQEQIQQNLPSLRFAQDYGVNLMKLKQEDPAMARTIEDDVKYWYDFIDEKSEFWNNAIRNKTKDYHAALQMQANSYAALAKLSLAAKAPAEQRQYYLMSDAQFDTAYDAAERAYTRAEQEYQIAKKDSSGEMDDVISAPKAALEKATQMKNLMDQIKKDRASNSTVNLLAQQMQIHEAAKTKDKEYASTKEYVDENQAAGKITLKTKDWTLKINPWTENPSQNWAAVRDIGWSADDFARTHDVKGSRYSALINEWSLICGRIASLFGENQYFATDKDFVGASLDYIQALFGANRANTDVNYKWFRDECLMAFRGNYDDTGSDAQKEQMDAMLTLANLMTDEERARFNALLDTMGARAADEYFELLYKTVLPERFTAYVSDYNAEYMEELPGIAKPALSVVSVLPSLTQGIPGIVNAYKTNQQDPAAARVSAAGYNQAQNIRNARMQKFGKFGQFAYGTTMSMWDSYFVAAITGGLGKAFAAAGVPTEAVIGGKTVNIAEKAASVIGGSLLGASAYNSTYQEGLERGLTPEKARMTALGSGINEMLFESLSLDMLVGHFQKGGILKVSKKAWVNWIVNTLVQGGVEGSEEDFTDMANNLWDKMVNGIFSEELTKLREYMAQGMSYDKAKKKVAAEFDERLGMSFFGGFASGGVMGGGSTFLGMIQNRSIEKRGAQMDASVRTEIDNFKFTNKQAQELQQQSKKTNMDYGMLEAMMYQQMFAEGKAYVQKALNDGTITQEQKDLYDKYAKLAAENKLTDEMLADEQVMQDMEKLEPVFDIMDEGEMIKNGMRDLAEAQRAVRDENAKYDKQVAAIENDTTLTDEQKRQKLDAIENERGEKVVEKVRDLEKVQKKYDVKVDAENGKVETKRGSIAYDFSTSNNAKTFDEMSDRQKSALRFAKLFADKYGMNIKVVDDSVAGEREDGHYNHDTDTITINISGANSVMYTVSHEVTHWLQEHNSKAYKSLKAAIEKELSRTDLIVSELPESYQRVMGDYKTADNTVMDALVKYEQDMYKRSTGKDLSRERAEDEVVARCCESFLKDRGFAQKMVASDPGTARTIASKLRQLANDMQTLNEDALERGYSKYGDLIDNSIAKAALEQIGDIEKIARMWENALNQAAKKAAKTKARAEAKTEVQHSFNTKMSDAQYAALASKVKDGTATDADKADLRKQVDAAAKSAGYPIHAYRGGGNVHNVFDTNRGAGTTQYGRGTYFTDAKGLAKEWAAERAGEPDKGYVGEYYVGIKKMFDDTSTIEPTQEWKNVERILKGYGVDSARIKHAQNYGFEGIAKALQSVGIISKGAFDAYSWKNAEKVNKILREAGYDGIKGEFYDSYQYVIFNPAQAKSADLVTYDDSGNIIPLSERFKTDRTGEEAWKNEDIRYSMNDKDYVAGRLGNQEYLKYLQLGAKVVNQTATEAEIKEFKQRMNQLSQDNREAFLDKLREKLIRADEAAKVREVRDRQIARLKEEFKESREKARERRIRSDLTNTLKKGNDRIVQLLARPTENAHVPVQLAQAVAEYAQRLNQLLTTSEPKTGEFAGQEKQTQKGALNAQKILDALKRSYADAETIEMLKAEDPSFDPRGLIPVQYDENGKMIKDDSLAEMVRGMDEIIQGKHLNELTTDELRYVMNTMRGVIYAVTEANKVTVDGESRNVYRTSRKMANEVKSASKVFGNKSNAVTKFLNRYVIESLGLRRIAKLYSGSNENATFVKLVDDLNQGAIEQERIKQTLRNMFNDVTQKYEKDMKTWYGKNAEWIDTGFGFKITKGMRVSLAMHILNEQNLRNVEKAGLRIPEQSAYRKGNYKEAYKNGKVYRLTKAQAEQIVSHMTEAEKAYFEVAKEFFHKKSGKYINRTSLKLLGFSKAIVDNYFPIQTDDAYRTVKYDDVRQNGSVEHPGFLEARKGTANVMYLNDITAVVNRQIEGVAKYAGLAIPMRNWNNVMNAWLFEENENGEWVRSDEGRPHDVLERRMGYTNGKGKAVMDYVDQFISDLTSPGMRDANENVQAAEFAAKLTSNYVKAVLTLNARVALSQLASVPTAAAEIPWKYIVQGFAGNVEQHLNRNASNELIDMYTPLFAMRRAGTQTEVSEIMKRKGLSEKAEQKLPWALGWITAMDTAATRRLWYACERWVKGETNIPVGSDAFYQEVAKRYERVIQNTQPNFTVLQRSPALRSKNAAARIITMFGTQRMQNAGVFIESVAEVVQAKDKATRKAALKKFGRTLSGLITAAIVIGLERAIVSALRGRMRPLQDEDKEITAKSVDKYIRGEVATSLAGSFMYVGEIYDFVNSIVSGFTEGDTGYENSFALPAAEALSTMIKFFKDAVPFMLNINAVDENGKPKYDDHQKWLKTKSFINGLMTAASYATGLPLQNASKTILNGWLPLGQDIADAIKTGEFIPYLNQSGKLDSSKTAANYKEWTNDGKKGSVYLYWERVAKDLPKEKDSGYPKSDMLSSKLMADRDLTPEEKATLYRMLGGDLVQEGSVVYHPLTVNQKYLKDKEHGTIAVDFTNYSRYQMSQMDDAKYNGFMKAVEMGVPEDLAATAYRNYASAKKYETKRGVDAKDRFHDWLFKMVSDPAQRAILDMQVVGSTKSVNGSIGYKAKKDGRTYDENGYIYRDYTSVAWYKLSNRTLSKDGKNKRYETAQTLTKQGYTAEQVVATYVELDKLSKKSEWQKYLKDNGYTTEQINLFLWSRGWAELK